MAVNPFGEDDDDFDIIGLFESHVQVLQNSMNTYSMFYKISSMIFENVNFKKKVLFISIFNI